MVILFTLTGLGLGYGLGVAHAYKSCIEIGTKILDIELRADFIKDFPKLVSYLKN